ncbi:MAG: propionyl-coenzyme A carboxylase alpha polypeptide [Mesorhizobium sp.]|nr:MAG: propionyl-coenzyme A carboxylase alpha polypeptide [Mesorhizobium sp.]RWB16248.1 MAG: propionyl-coenzyme A carboxylase alpha polypeptide [Mesorhizobium sp.]TIS44498.1 MAG: propionyl-coenzyme A carboxylase alpha polypeptide [Mesorhizobium sp.]
MPCRASPPQGGRSAVTPAFANHRRCRMSQAPELPISPLEGEMSGRTEGGAVPPALE